MNLDIIKYWEKCRLKAYLCEAGRPTIGWGATYYPRTGKPVKLGDTITQAEADQMLIDITGDFAARIKKHITAQVNPNQFSALLSLAYNIGYGGLIDSSLLKMVNENHNNPAIAGKFAEWNKVRKNGKLVPSKGLTARRKQEAALYFTPYPQASA